LGGGVEGEAGGVVKDDVVGASVGGVEDVAVDREGASRDAGEAGDRVGSEVDGADDVVAGVGDVECARGGGEGGGEVEAGGGTGAVSPAGEAGGAGGGGDRAECPEILLLVRGEIMTVGLRMRELAALSHRVLQLPLLLFTLPPSERIAPCECGRR
jgi:hypothetical protein